MFIEARKRKFMSEGQLCELHRCRHISLSFNTTVKAECKTLLQMGRFIAQDTLPWFQRGNREW